MSEKVDMITDAARELQSNEELGRVAGEVIQEIAKRGRGAFEALFEMLLSLSEDELNEIGSAFEEFLVELDKQLPGSDEPDEDDDPFPASDLVEDAGEAN